MTLLAFEVIGKPHGAQRHRTQRVGQNVHMHRTHTHIAAEEHIATVAANAAFGQRCVVQEEPVRLVVTTWHRRPQSMAVARKWHGDGARPYAGKPDADNIAKLVMDALTRAGVWTDDTVVAQLEVRRWWVAVGEDGTQGAERTCVQVEAL